MHSYQEKIKYVGVRVFNATFNTISVTSWWSVLLVEETTDGVIQMDNYKKCILHKQGK